MTDIRCVKCNRLLFKQIDFRGSIEVKCSKCGFVQIVKDKKLYPRVKEINNGTSLREFCK